MRIVVAVKRIREKVLVEKAVQGGCHLRARAGRWSAGLQIEGDWCGSARAECRESPIECCIAGNADESERLFVGRSRVRARILV